MTKEERRRIQKRQQYRKKKRRKRNIRIAARMGILILILVVIAMLLAGIFKLVRNWIVGGTQDALQEKIVETQPDIDVQLLTVNEYSRPGIAMEEVNSIVIHYTANPGSTAQQNRDYFEGLKDSHETYASSHFVIGLEGEIIQCIPTAEESYASNERNSDTVSIECCHADETGEFNEATYQSLVEMTAWLCGKFHLTTEDVIRHYDVTEKMCPLYYVENEDAWQQFLEDVDSYIDTYGVVAEDTE